MTKVRALSLTMAMILFAVLIGVLVGHQIVIKKGIDQALDPNTTESMAIEVAQLIKDNQDLRKKRDILIDERDKFLNQSTNRRAAVEAVSSNIDEYGVIAGTSQVTGKGVVVTISHEMALTQLIDLVNAIRNSGAEALSINGRRIVASSGFTSGDLQKNYRLEIIGNPRVLADALERKGGILDQITNGQVEEKDGLVLPPVGA